MKRTFATIAVFLVLLLIPFVVWAQTNVTLWDFLSGGDGVRWKAIINEFNTSQSEAFALCPLGAAEATQPDVARSRSKVTAGAMGWLSTALCLP